MEWRGGRLERLLAPNGYLTQIGLYWLDERVYTIGSDPGSDIVVPATAAARIGELRVAPDGVWLVVEEGVEVLQDGEPVSEVSPAKIRSWSRIAHLPGASLNAMARLPFEFGITSIHSSTLSDRCLTTKSILHIV
jgi:hypothetical protein